MHKRWKFNANHNVNSNLVCQVCCQIGQDPSFHQCMSYAWSCILWLLVDVFFKEAKTLGFCFSSKSILNFSNGWELMFWCFLAVIFLEKPNTYFADKPIRQLQTFRKWSSVVRSSHGTPFLCCCFLVRIQDLFSALCITYCPGSFWIHLAVNLLLYVCSSATLRDLCAPFENVVRVKALKWISFLFFFFPLFDKKDWKLKKCHKALLGFDMAWCNIFSVGQQNKNRSESLFCSVTLWDIDLC